MGCLCCYCRVVELTTWPVGDGDAALVVVLTTLVELTTWVVGGDDVLFECVSLSSHSVCLLSLLRFL